MSAVKLRQFAAGLLGRSSPLVLSRLCSAALTFALPLVLVRLLSPDAFGTYKQFFLVAQTLLLVGQLGLTQSLYYFLPRGGPERGAYVTHALVLLSAAGAAVGAGLYLGAPLLGHVVGGELGELRAPLALFAAAMLAASPLEGALTSESRIGGAAVAYVLSDAVRAAALIAGATIGRRWFGAAGLYWAAALVGILRLAALGTLVARRLLPATRPSRGALRAQLAFALPFAGAMWLYVAQRYFAQYAVSARFSPAVFALYAVASFHLPVVDIVFTPISEVLMVELGRAFAKGGAGGRGASAMRAWDDAIEKLATLLFPAACGAWLFGPTVLPMLFTHKYDGAVPLFLLATVEIPLWILPCDALLRAAGDTRFLFAFNGARVGLTAGCVLGGMRLFGLPGAIAGGVTSEAIARLAMVVRGRRFLGTRLAETLDWATIGRIAAAAALACVPALVLRRLPLSTGLRLLLPALAYAGAYAPLRAWLLRARPAPLPAVTPAGAAR